MIISFPPNGLLNLAFNKIALIMVILVHFFFT
jgi:hypothetical protein